MKVINNPNRQRGLSIINLIVLLVALAFIGITVAKLVPSYNEWNGIRKVLAEMDAQGDSAKGVREIRASFDRRAIIGYIDTVKGEDLEITKEAGEVTISVSYSKKIPIVANINFCIDFYATSKPTTASKG